VYWRVSQNGEIIAIEITVLCLNGPNTNIIVLTLSSLFMHMVYRVWNPFRSKLAAAILGGVDKIHIAPGSKVLYIGAAAGTTVSHVSDIVGPTGCVYAVEFAHRPGTLLTMTVLMTLYDVVYIMRIGIDVTLTFNYTFEYQCCIFNSYLQCVPSHLISLLLIYTRT